MRKFLIIVFASMFSIASLVMLSIGVYSFAISDGKMGISGLAYACAAGIITTLIISNVKRDINKVAYQIILISPAISGVLFIGVISIVSIVSTYQLIVT